MFTKTIAPVDSSDADLVAQSLAGRREAFGHVVARYQSLVCSIAYNSTGSIAQSEDVAQDVFLSAWKQLGQLREPAKLRSWLCGIARNLLRNNFRRGNRDPIHGATSLDDLPEASTGEPLPSELTISREEEGILWRSLELIPETYREPLILFYREHHSVERVALALELSEEVVRQRLSRGRKLLHEQVIAFVERALEQTAPGQALTFSVMSALPQLVIATGSAATGVVTTKGTALAKIATSTRLIAAIFSPLLGLFALSVVGSELLVQNTESARERKYVRKAWVLSWLAIALYILGLCIAFPAGGVYWKSHPRLLVFNLMIAVFGFAACAGLFSLWVSCAQIRIRKKESADSSESPFISPVAGLGRYEYRSRRELLGLPLIHVRFQCVENGKTMPAKGWIAVGNKAYGILFAAGSIAVGFVSMGPLAIGLFAMGGLGIGLLSFGGLSIGGAAIGGGAIGYVAFGGAAIGWLGATGGVAISRHFACAGVALAEHANDQAAHNFVRSNVFFGHAQSAFYVLIVVSWLPAAISLFFKRRRDHQRHALKSTMAVMLLVSAFVLAPKSARAEEARPAPSFIVTIRGEGRPVIFIPGLSCAGAVWDGSVARYKDRYECHVLTLAGFAGQPRIASPFLETVRSDLAAYIKSHKLDHPIIIGHSLGGFIALALASHDPEIVGPLGIVDALPFLPAGFDPGATASMMKPMAEQMRSGLSAGGEPFLRQSESAIKTMVTKPADVALVLSWARTTDPVAVGNAVYEMYTTDLREDLANIRSPALVLGSWIAYKDYTTRDKMEQKFRSQYVGLKRCRLMMADHAHHFIMLDDPVWFYDQLDGFFAATASK